ncbi:MAG TPA: hypothetical protein VK099_06410 [Alcanivoracaceae bacterium]|nr:hypothetical protein [Alcanivoracaceae bacterium]
MKTELKKALQNIDDQLLGIKEATRALDTISRLPIQTDDTNKLLNAVTIEGYTATLQLVVEKLERCHSEASDALLDCMLQIRKD